MNTIVFAVTITFIIAFVIMFVYDIIKTPRVSVPRLDILNDPIKLSQFHESINEQHFIKAYGREKGIRWWNLYLVSKSNGKSMRKFLQQLSKYEGPATVQKLINKTFS